MRSLGAAGVILASALGAMACAPESEPTSTRPPAILLWDVTVRHYETEGAPRVVHADEVSFDRENAQVFARTITADVPATPTLRRGGVHFTAESGEGDIHGERAEAFGPIEVTTGAGDRGQTVGSVWDSETGTISGAKPVQVHGPGYTVDSRSYSFRLDDQQLELEGGVHAVSRLAESRKQP
ncbi:hypothetical protein [Vulgatibacter incomptus]|uniref:Lipoprotein n=1 Tax=Vulgatibacter incomptus TaxID=1391653 RepID=A0A0K1PFQ0_9BACT|nr:hypothetical protein [Vulgatibacter incomptus]AKU92236.1 hypothetical protein AKJ08_2623 [Vulgatibacter incomptus]